GRDGSSEPPSCSPAESLSRWRMRAPISNRQETVMRFICATVAVVVMVLSAASVATANSPSMQGWWFIPPVFGGMQAAPPKTASDVDTVVDGMQKYYEKARTYSAEFKQVYEEING